MPKLSEKHNTFPSSLFSSLAKKIYSSVAKLVNAEYKTAEKNLLSGINPDDIVSLCRGISKSQESDPNGKGGDNRCLVVALIEFRKQFEKLDPEAIDALGINGKTKEDITHFDLMEIGLFGKVDTKDKTPAQIAARNQNLIEIYSSKNNDPHSIGVRSLPDFINSDLKREQAFSQNDLYHSIVEFCQNKITNKNTDIEKVFLEKIHNALKINNGFNVKIFVFGADSDKVVEIKKSYAETDNLNALLEKLKSDLSDANAKKRNLLVEIFENTGILDSVGNIVIAHSQIELRGQVKQDSIQPPIST